MPLWKQVLTIFYLTTFLFLFFNFYYGYKSVYKGMLLILATSPWGLYKFWGGGVPTLDIYYSVYILHRLLLRIIIGPVPPSPPTIQCPASPYVFFWPASAQDYPPTQASPVSVPEYQKNPSPSLPSPVTTRYWIILSYPAPTMPSRFPLLLLPHCYQNIF